MFHRDFSTGGGICTQGPHCLGRSLAPEVTGCPEWSTICEVGQWI